MTDANTNDPVDVSIDDEKDRTERVCIYLRNLRYRLRSACEQHNAAIQNSLAIIKEMHDVSTHLVNDAGQACPTLYSMRKIKSLILEFEREHASSPKCQDLEQNDVADLHQLLNEFERLHHSSLLRESLLKFKIAKESFENIDAFLGDFSRKAGNVDSPTPSPKPSANNLSLREKIQLFNMTAEPDKNNTHHFAICFSNTSVEEMFETAADLKTVHAASCTNSTNCQSGYEGDVDSEPERIVNG